MVLTKEDNDLLTRVGPGTPAGELLRRYWLPVAIAQELTEEQPTKFVRVLGEDLVLFKDKSGNAGLIQDHCPHRGASLLYGRVEERGISCAYHGWLYDTAGNCLETPAEPTGSMFHLTVKAKAYPVQRSMGFYWAYLGPQPAPALPRYDLWVRKDGHRQITVHPLLDCNWFQAMENSVDPAHLQILHQDQGTNVLGGRRALNTTRGFTDDVESFDFYLVDYGIMKKRIYKNGLVDEHPLIFPNILRVDNGTQIRVPIDDTHTWHYSIQFKATEDGQEIDEEPEIRYAKPYKEPGTGVHPYTHFTMAHVLAQDVMAWETQGPVADRSVERLATSDRGVVMLRNLLRQEIERVQRGEDPMSIVRDPAHAMIDTNLHTSLTDYVGRFRGTQG